MIWPGKRSYTGQPLAEFHVPGAAPVLDALLEDVIAADRVRLAERGEFTMRAFLSGRIDLPQAEAVLGVIDAADHEELRQALAQLNGTLTQQLASVRDDLIRLLGDLEAGLDFVEEDIQFVDSADVSARLQHSLTVIARLAGESQQRLPSGHRLRVVLVGLPNAGKSTLFNALVRADRALVSSTAGTTRDYLTATVDVHGLPVELIDTAGWEDPADRISTSAQQQRTQQAAQADLVVWCRAADLADALQPVDRERYAELQQSVRQSLVLLTCCDRLADGSDAVTASAAAVSARTGDGMDRLRQIVAAHLVTARSSRGEVLSSTAVRCRGSLERAAAALRNAATSVQTAAGDEITALEIRQALHETGVVLGEVCTDDILDHIFSSFCIGK